MTLQTAPPGNSRLISPSRRGPLLSLAFGFGALLTACSGGSLGNSGAASGPMQIVSCSLSCGGGSGGTQINCGLNQVAVNETLTIDFSHPVDLGTVSKTTFQITDVATGKSPAGSFSIAPNNPNRLLFRPRLTFNASGNPIFGFEEAHSYQVLIRGKNQDSGGNFVASVGGKDNTSRMHCTVAAGGIQDPVAGPPTVVVRVDVVTAVDPENGDVLAFEQQVASGGALLQEVKADTAIRMTFNDVMNPATLVNPVTKDSTTIGVFVDPDGNTLDASDQVELFGAFSIVIDETSLTTVVEFTPSGGLPSAGSGSSPRKVVVRLPNTIVDLGTNSLTNFGEIVFVPQVQLFESVVLPLGGEQFTGTALRDTDSTSALWGGGALIRGKSGGSGRLGPLVVRMEDSPMTLNTDSQVVEGLDVVGEGAAIFPPSPAPPTTTVVGGVFEYSKVVVEPGAVLQFTGSNPARLFARGLAFVENTALIDVGGSSPVDNVGSEVNPAGHNSAQLAGGAGGLAGPGGGAGGKGADRPDDTDASLLSIGGAPNPGALVVGSSGEGVGGAVGLGSGPGGLPWPATVPSNAGDLTGYLFNFSCTLGLVAGPGGGGAYGTAGGESSTNLVQTEQYDLSTPGLFSPVTPGGDESTVGLTLAARTLDPNLGFLRGGAGGGGGGLQFTRSKSDGMPDLPSFSCLNSTVLSSYLPQSASGGAGGGGALQLQAGRTLKVEGAIRSLGGRGGDSQGGISSTVTFEQAAPGGGGAGGAVLLQAPSLLIASVPGRVSVEGGEGGSGPGKLPGSRGGSGGAGLVRLEADFAPSALLQAKNLAPFDGAPGSVTGGEESLNILSTGVLAQGFTGPEGRSGAQSCWMVPAGNFFVLDFQADDLTDPLSPDLGWDADVVTTIAGLAPFSFRDGTDPGNPFGASPEALLGSDLGGASPGVIVVRFQGVHGLKAVNSFCDVDLNAVGGEVDVQSLTAWVRHPSELNTYWESALPGQPELAGKRRPNMFRYQVIFDGNAPNSSLVAGLTNFRVRATPD